MKYKKTHIIVLLLVLPVCGSKHFLSAVSQPQALLVDKVYSPMIKHSVTAQYIGLVTIA